MKTRSKPDTATTTVIEHPMSMRNFLTCVLVAVALLFAIVRVSNAYAVYQASTTIIKLKVPPPSEHKLRACPPGDPCRMRIVNRI